MSTAAEMVEVVCSRCGEHYREWCSPLLERSVPSACPHCGLDQATDPILRENGVWSTAPEDEARDR